MGGNVGVSNGAPVVNAMTVDVEDYYHVSAFDRTVFRSDWEAMEARVERNTRRLLDLLERFDVRGTFFVLGCVAERHPDLVRAIASHGHEVASHGYGHRLVYEQLPAEFRDDVRRAKRMLEDIVGVPVVGYRAPSYSITGRSLWALDILVDEGHEYDSSIFPVRHDRYGIPDAPRHAYIIRCRNGLLTEVPPSTVRIGSFNLPATGGGYFRILPYAWTRWGIARLNEREQRPAVFYIHPWEIDPDQPRLPADPLSRFRHYRHLGRVEGRLQRLLRDFRFGPLGLLLSGPATKPETSFATGVLAAAGPMLPVTARNHGRMDP